jgi:uncharacterized integral membrane protein
MSRSDEFKHLLKMRQPFQARMMPLLVILTVLTVVEALQVVYSVLANPVQMPMLVLSLAGLGFAIIVMIILIVSIRRHRDQ